MRMRMWMPAIASVLIGAALGGCSRERVSNPRAVRVATFNIENVSADELRDRDNERVRRAASIVQRIAPDIILINEIPYDEHNDWASVFARDFVSQPQPGGRAGLSYRGYAWPSNTGIHSGFDLDNNGEIDPTPGSRPYGGDSLGYGEYPGHYAMALLVRDGFEVIEEDVRTFRETLWRDVPRALLPIDPESGTPWYADEELAVLPLSSKSHWDVPVRLPNGAVLHLLASHPTPPVFDGEEDRNGRRNSDEIRFWREYLDGARWIVDDRGRRGGLGPGAHFVIAGDLNADPDEGDSRRDPVGRFLLAHPRVNGQVAPVSSVPIRGLDPDDTAAFGLRVDYVLPSTGVAVVGAAVWRNTVDDPAVRLSARRAPVALPMADFPSDHFPVWIELVVPGP